MNAIKQFFQSVYYRTIGRLVREYRYRKRLRELKKRDPFIY